MKRVQGDNLKDGWKRREKMTSGMDGDNINPPFGIRED